MKEIGIWERFKLNGRWDDEGMFQNRLQPVTLWYWWQENFRDRDGALTDGFRFQPRSMFVGVGQPEAFTACMT